MSKPGAPVIAIIIIFILLAVCALAVAAVIIIVVLIRRKKYRGSLSITKPPYDTALPLSISLNQSVLNDKEVEVSQIETSKEDITCVDGEVDGKDQTVPVKQNDV